MPKGVPRGSLNRPNKLHIAIDPDLAEKLAREFGHLYWAFPDNHPIRLHRAPGLMVLAHPQHHRAYVFSSGKDNVLRRAQMLMASMRAEGSPKARMPKISTAPDQHMLRRNPRTVPPLLVRDWERDGPEAFRWTLAQKLPPRCWNDPRFGDGGERQKQYTHFLRERMRQIRERLSAAGWEIYNPPLVRGGGLPGVQRAYQEQRDAYDAARAEEKRNHLNWLDWTELMGEGQLGAHLIPRAGVDPMDPDIQRAYARYCASYYGEKPLPKPGDSMPGRTSKDKFMFRLPQGQMTVDCPETCPRYVRWSSEHPDD